MRRNARSERPGRVDAKSESGKTARDYALSRKHEKVAAFLVEKLRFSNLEDFANSLDDTTIETVLVQPCNLADAHTVTLGRVRQAHKAVKTALMIAAKHGESEIARVTRAGRMKSKIY